MQNAVIYARFSSDMQREESIDAQIRACQQFAIRKGLNVVHIYADRAKSATSVAGRDQYRQMLADAQAHKFDAVIFHKIDRNARNELDYYITKNTLQKLGIRYYYSGQDVDTASPEGQLMEGMLMAYAAYYSRNLAEESKKGMRENAYKALFNGGIAPLGYKIVDKKYVIDEKEAPAVRMVFDMYCDDKGYTTIAKALDLAGYRSKRGTPFAKNSIYDILGNEKYIGRYVFGATPKRSKGIKTRTVDEEAIVIDNIIPPIISKEQWDMVQLKRKQNRRRTNLFRQNANEYLLTGKIFCGCCGGAMSGRVNHKNGRDYYYYACLQKERVATSDCTQCYIDMAAVDNFVIETIRREILSDAGRKKLKAYVHDAFSSFYKGKAVEFDKLSRQLEEAKRKRKKLMALLDVGVLTEEEVAELRENKNLIEQLKAEMDALAKEGHKKVLTDEQVDAAIDALKNDNSQTFYKLLVKYFVEKVIIDNKKATLVTTLERLFPPVLVPRTGIEPVRVSLPEGF